MKTLMEDVLRLIPVWTSTLQRNAPVEVPSMPDTEGKYWCSTINRRICAKIPRDTRGGSYGTRTEKHHGGFRDRNASEHQGRRRRQRRRKSRK